jgi:hypothetical protein
MIATLALCVDQEGTVRRQTFYEDYAHARVTAAEFRRAQGATKASTGNCATNAATWNGFGIDARRKS